jgi:hypothetical protein
MNTQLAEEIIGWFWLGCVVAAVVVLWRRRLRSLLRIAPPLFSYPLSIAWYRLWWDFGWIAPPGFLHGLPGIDGEASYDATHLEMLTLLLLALALLAVITDGILGPKKKPNQPPEPTRLGGPRFCTCRIRST